MSHTPPGDYGGRDRLSPDLYEESETDPGADEPPARIFVALFDYDPLSMSPNPDAAEELPFKEGQIIKVGAQRGAGRTAGPGDRGRSAGGEDQEGDRHAGKRSSRCRPPAEDAGGHPAGHDAGAPSVQRPDSCNTRPGAPSSRGRSRVRRPHASPRHFHVGGRGWGPPMQAVSCVSSSVSCRGPATPTTPPSRGPGRANLEDLAARGARARQWDPTVRGGRVSEPTKHQASPSSRPRSMATRTRMGSTAGRPVPGSASSPATWSRKSRPMTTR